MTLCQATVTASGDTEYRYWTAFSLEKTALLEGCRVYMDALLLSLVLPVYPTDNCFHEGDFTCNPFTQIECGAQNLPNISIEEEQQKELK